MYAKEIAGILESEVSCWASGASNLRWVLRMQGYTANQKATDVLSVVRAWPSEQRRGDGAGGGDLRHCALLLRATPPSLVLTPQSSDLDLSLVRLVS